MSLNVSQPYGPSRPGTGIALLYVNIVTRVWAGCQQGEEISSSPQCPAGSGVQPLFYPSSTWAGN